MSGEKAVAGTYVVYDANGKLQEIRQLEDIWECYTAEDKRLADLQEANRTEEVVYEELQFTNPMTIPNEPNKGWMIDLNGDGKLDKMYFGKWGLMLNGKAYLQDQINGYSDPIEEWWLIDIDKEDGMLELILEAVVDGGYGYNVFHYDGTEVKNVGYSSSKHHEVSIINPVFLDDGTILCENFYTGALEKMNVVVQLGFDENGQLTEIEKEYEVSDDVTLTLISEITFYAERSMASESIRVAPGQKVHLTKTDIAHWIYLVAEDGSEGWIYHEPAETERGTINGDKKVKEYFTDFITAG